MKYLLIHGSFQQSWAWRQLVPLLEAQGHRVECIDLPLPDESPGSVTYDDYYQRVEAALLRQTEPIVLVAHSMAGILAAPLADRYPDRVAHTFFISCYIPGYQQSLFDVASQFSGSAIPEILRADKEANLHYLDLEGAKEAFFHDCPPELQEWASKRLTPQPVLPLKHKLDWQDSGKTANQRTYILCTRDRDVVPEAQRHCIQLHPSRVIEMESCHFPFLSKPAELAALLSDVEAGSA